METIIVIFLLAVIALVLVYMIYGRYRREKKSTEPTLYIEGLQALLDGKEEMAFSRFREVVSEDTSNIDAYVRIGNILRKYGKADRALQVHKDLTIRHDLTVTQKVRILKALAEDFFDLEDYDSAIAALDELLTLDSQSRRAVEKLLQCHEKKQDWEAAYTAKERLLKLNGTKSKSGLAIYKFFQGERLFAEREYHKARIIFKEAINLDSGCVPAYIYMGDSYLAENRIDDAISIWKKMIKVVPDKAHLVLSRLKKTLFEVGKFGEISSICTEILEDAPKNLYARLTLAEYHNKKGEDNLALEQLNLALEHNPDSYLPIFGLARIYIESGDKKKLYDLLHRMEVRSEFVDQEFKYEYSGYNFNTQKKIVPELQRS